MPLLSEIARISGGRIITRDSMTYMERKNKALAELKEAKESGDEEWIKQMESVLEDIEKDLKESKDSTKDSDNVAEIRRIKEEIEGLYASLKNEKQESQVYKEIQEEIKGYQEHLHQLRGTKDSVVSTLTDLAKNLGSSLMEPTEKAAAGDTKDEQKYDPAFIRSVAKHMGVRENLSDADCKRAHDTVVENHSEQDYYYGMKEYFLN